MPGTVGRVLPNTELRVVDAAVLGREDPDDGEVPVAVVVPHHGACLDPADLLAWVAEPVAPHKRLRAVRLADAIPRTPSGKLLRRALRDAVRASAAGPMTTGLRRLPPAARRRPSAAGPARR